ncbi:hypothetical protein LL037_20555 [Clostridium estertheticum]|uniref:DUF3185 family protein n=1 Tax=Clostridium estertheticum TaxID=238834 RepID=A0AA47I6X8_9CLOT|nr:hypothetical protein [Clostridium estertheticum]MBU3153614.1 hypothetical protein [Clostridium estertheticum]MBU3200710.1 hypothetical protein [Clostridium estertheticum]WAG61013.1 hypothetical protein LL038_01820 [Clostridium estertheticum]WAG64831.1 hypothetical protein LL037_20555 [Clostridium estertheticum]
MTKKNLIKIFAIVFIIGLIILMNSINLGTYAVDNNGVLSNYQIVLEQSIMNYRLLGGILSILSGIGVIINMSAKS